MTKAVIFDVDGVILDTEPLAAQASIQAIREMYGVHLKPEDFHEFLGEGIHDYLKGALSKYGVTLDRPKHLIQRRLELLEVLMRSQLKTFPGIIGFIRKVQDSGLKTAIATSSQHQKVVDGFKDVGIDISEFDVFLSGDDIRHPKPDPEIYLKTAEELDLPAHECMVIEDSLHGIKAAKAANMLCVAVTNSFPEEQLQAAGADIITDSLETVSLFDIKYA